MLGVLLDGVACSSPHLEHLKQIYALIFFLMVLQIHIVQRGAVPPLIEMLHSVDAQLREMSAFALGRLAQVT